LELRPRSLIAVRKRVRQSSAMAGLCPAAGEKSHMKYPIDKWDISHLLCMNEFG